MTGDRANRRYVLERSLAGLCLLSQSAAAAVCDRVRPAHLTGSPAGQFIETVRELVLNGDTVDPLTISGRLRATRPDVFETIGGERGVDAMSAEACSASAMDAACRELATLAAWDTRTQMAYTAVTAAQAEDEQAWAAAQAAVVDQDPAADEFATVTPEQWAERMWAYLENPTEEQQPIPTPWEEINDGLNGGLRRGQLVLVMGLTNHGKSVIAGDLAHHAARHGHRSHLYLTEDAGDQRGARWLTRMTGVPTKRIERRQLTDRDRERVVSALDRPPYGHTPVAGRSVAEICAHIRRSKWDLAVLDHLHDLAYQDERELADMVTQLKAEASRGRTCIVVCAQPSKPQRIGTTKKTAEPILSSAKGAGAIGDAAMVGLIVHQDQDEDGVPTGFGTLRCAKSRTGKYPVVEVQMNDQWASMAPKHVLERELLDQIRTNRNGRKAA